MNRTRLLFLLVGFTLGAVAGGAFATHRARAIAVAESARRAAYVRALWHVTEDALGHDKAVKQWRTAIEAERVAPRGTTRKGAS
jgi:hypothetical protein